MPLETIKNCPICDSVSFSNYLNVQDYTVSNKEFTIQQCNKCDFLLTNPRPAEDEIGPYYESKEYISHHDESKDFISKVYKSVRDYTLKQKLKFINSLRPTKGSILDIGCGTGNFLQTMKTDGWQISGTEPDSGARNVAGSRVGVAINSSINDPFFEHKQYDVITLWHVLEHIHQLNDTVDWLKKHLKEDGRIIIAVPNPQSADAVKYGRFWAAYDVPRHLYHFTKRSMANLMEKHAMQIETVKPMWFDSFYVSMLSTKYKNGHTGLINSVKTGLMSNMKGNSSDDKALNTSSLFYIIKKK